MSGRYILEGHNAVLCDDLRAWARWLEGKDARRVKHTKFGKVNVSTVFLGIDHSFGGATPMLFETMVFGGPLDQEQDRYSNWEDAEKGHDAMVERVKSKPLPRA